MSSSDLSDLSSSLSSDEDIAAPTPKGTLEHYFSGQVGPDATVTSTSLKKKRPPSPPHEYVLADNPDIAVSLTTLYFTKSCCARLHVGIDTRTTQFICMFRSRFSDAFPKSLPHFGPQDIENGVVEPAPGEQVERLLCALLSLVLNRKKDIEYVSSNLVSSIGYLEFLHSVT